MAMAYECDRCGARIDDYEGTCSSCQGDPMEEELLYGDGGAAPPKASGGGGLLVLVIVVLVLFWVCRG